MGVGGQRGRFAGTFGSSVGTLVTNTPDHTLWNTTFLTAYAANTDS